ELETSHLENKNKTTALMLAEAEKTKAETELINSNHIINELKNNIEKYITSLENAENRVSKLEVLKAEYSAKYEESLKAVEEQKKFVQDANNAMKDAFNSLSSEALKSNNQSFLDLAKTALEKQITETKGDLEKRQLAIDSMVKPLSESLSKFDNKIQEIEKARQGAYSEIKVFLDGVKGTTEKLQKETNTLVSALKTSQTRGKYGEIGLRRIVEAAGMSEFCDFEEQKSVTTEEGRLRPDMLVKLPGQRTLVVDSKVPLAAYMQAFETVDENEKKAFLKKHADAVREHLKSLSTKAYWGQFKDSPDYVIMYMQIESSFGAALEIDRTLIEDGMNNKIIFATPTTLITLLRTIAFSWQQVNVTNNIIQIKDAGIELFNRVTVLIQHLADIGNGLNSVTQSYNSAIGSLESRFIPQVKRLKELGGTLMDKNIPELKGIDSTTRPINKTFENKSSNESEDLASKTSGS
ncbi:MAG: DNA recombination protein RmuC, partial [Bacteroidota bacterium]